MPDMLSRLSKIVIAFVRWWRLRDTSPVRAAHAPMLPS
jgi:hypothetical protein